MCLGVCLSAWLCTMFMEGTRCPRTGVTDGGKLPCGCWDCCPRPLEEQPVFSAPMREFLKYCFLSLASMYTGSCSMWETEGHSVCVFSWEMESVILRIPTVLIALFHMKAEVCKAPWEMFGLPRLLYRIYKINDLIVRRQWLSYDNSVELRKRIHLYFQLAFYF